MRIMKLLSRRVLAVLLTLVMCLGMLPGTALAYYENQGFTNGNGIWHTKYIDRYVYGAGGQPCITQWDFENQWHPGDPKEVFVPYWGYNDLRTLKKYCTAVNGWAVADNIRTSGSQAGIYVVPSVYLYDIMDIDDPDGIIDESKEITFTCDEVTTEGNMCTSLGMLMNVPVKKDATGTATVHYRVAFGFCDKIDQKTSNYRWEYNNIDFIINATPFEPDVTASHDLYIPAGYSATISLGKSYNSDYSAPYEVSRINYEQGDASVASIMNNEIGYVYSTQMDLNRPIYDIVTIHAADNAQVGATTQLYVTYRGEYNTYRLFYWDYTWIPTLQDTKDFMDVINVHIVPAQTINLNTTNNTTETITPQKKTGDGALSSNDVVFQGYEDGKTLSQNHRTITGDALTASRDNDEVVTLTATKDGKIDIEHQYHYYDAKTNSNSSRGTVYYDELAWYVDVLNVNVGEQADTPDSIDGLIITKTVDKATAEVNDELTYTITVTNPGSQPVTGVTVTDVLPEGVEFVDGGDGSYVSSTRTITWSNQTVPAKDGSQDGKLELTLKIKVKEEGTVSNTATLTVPDETPVTSAPAETTVGPKSEPRIKVTKRMGTPVVDAEAGTATVDYTVTVKNTGNKTLYGLRIDDTLTTTVNSSSAEMTIIPVSGYIGDEDESAVTPDGETERSWTLLDRNDEFAQGQEKVLKYQLILENTGDDELSVDLENTAVGGSWSAPEAAPQGVRTLALDGDAPDVTDDSTASDSWGSSSGSVTIPPKPSGDACGHPHDGDGSCTKPGCTHTEEGKDCCPKPAEPEPPETFTVTWIDRLTDETIDRQTVTSLAEAVYPEHPAHKGYQGSGWSRPVPDGDGNYTIYAEYVELQVDPEAPSYAYLRDELGITVQVECDADATHEPLDYEVPLKAGSYSADVRGSRCVITIAPDLYVAECGGEHSIDGISPQTIELLYEDSDVIEAPDHEDPDVPTDGPVSDVGDPDDLSDGEPAAPSGEDPIPSNEDPAAPSEQPAPSNEDADASGEPVQFSALSLADDPAGSWQLADGETGTVTFSVHCEEPDVPDVPDVPETLEVTVVWLDDEDGNTLKTAKVEVPADDPTSIPGRLYPRNPTRDGYRFTGWSDPVERDGVVTIVAQWEKLPEEERTLTVTWLDWDGVLLAREDWDPDDPEPRYPGRTPVRPDSSRYTYTFSGWDRQVDGEGNVTYTAVYTRDRIYDDDDGDNNYGGGTAPTPPATTIPDADVPQGGDTTTILDEQTPLAGAIGLNNTEHFAYMIGYENGTVRPLGQITRAEVATIFFRLMDDSFRSQYWSTASGFSDVAAGKWFNNAVSTGVNAGKLTGYPDGTFRPNQSITRAEFAAIAVRFLSDEVQGVSGGSFSDTAGHWAADAIGRAAAAGWITGYPDGAFRPNQSITRAEAATIINNMLGRAPDKDHLLAGMTTWPDNPEGAWYYEAIQEATNSHDYDRDELGVTEIWRAIQTVRDWKALEEQWAA